MDAEDVRKAFAFMLESEEFRTVLRNIWVAKGAGVEEVIYPAAIYDHVKWSPQDMPCGEVTVARGRNMHPDAQLIELDYEVLIFWHVNGTDEGPLEDQLARLLRATQDFFKSRVNLMPSWIASIWVGDEDHSPFVRWSDENAPLVKSGLQQLGAKVIR